MLLVALDLLKPPAKARVFVLGASLSNLVNSEMVLNDTAEKERDEHGPDVLTNETPQNPTFRSSL